MNCDTFNQIFKKEYIEKIFQDEISNVSNASQGNRNNQLNRSAFNLGTVVAAGALDRNSVEEVLLSAAEQNGLVQEEGEAAVWNTIKSGIDSGFQNPRTNLPQDISFANNADINSCHKDEKSNISEISTNPIYKYLDEKGKLLFEVIKIPETSKDKKKFYQKRYDVDGIPIHGILEGWYEKKEKGNYIYWRRIGSDKKRQPNQDVNLNSLVFGH